MTTKEHLKIFKMHAFVRLRLKKTKLLKFINSHKFLSQLLHSKCRILSHKFFLLLLFRLHLYPNNNNDKLFTKYEREKKKQFNEKPQIKYFSDIIKFPHCMYARKKIYFLFLLPFLFLLLPYFHFHLFQKKKYWCCLSKSFFLRTCRSNFMAILWTVCNDMYFTECILLSRWPSFRDMCGWDREWCERNVGSWLQEYGVKNLQDFFILKIIFFLVFLKDNFF